MGFNQGVIAGAKSSKGSFSRRMIIDGQEIFDQGKIANCFNKFFVDIGPKLASISLNRKQNLTSI